MRLQSIGGNNGRIVMGLILIGGIIGLLVPTNQRAACMCIGLAVGGLLAGGIIIVAPKASTCLAQSSGAGYLTFNSLKACDKV
jgi:hypothetical protein